MGLSHKKKVERYKGRLLKLADYLEFQVKPAVEAGKVKFNINYWAKGAKPRPELSCGTAACVAGFATNIFSRSGFVTRVAYKEATYFGVCDTNNRTSGFDACKTFFGTADPFDPRHYIENFENIKEDIDGHTNVPIDLAITELRRFATIYSDNLGRYELNG